MCSSEWMGNPFSDFKRAAKALISVVWRYTNEYNKLGAFSAAVWSQMPDCPLLAAPGSFSLFCSISHLLDFTSTFAATATPCPKTKPSPVRILVGCGMERSSACIWNGCDFALYIEQKWKTRSGVCLQTEIPNPNPEWRNRCYSAVRCLGPLPRKAGRESPDSDIYFKSSHFCSFFWFLT